MRTINYILVNETDAKTAARAIRNCKLPDIGHHLLVEAAGCDADLIRELVALRRHHPDAKILGISELGDYSVHPSERMNQLRRAMSDLP